MSKYIGSNFIQMYKTNFFLNLSSIQEIWVRHRPPDGYDVVFSLIGEERYDEDGNSTCHFLFDHFFETYESALESVKKILKKDSDYGDPDGDYPDFKEFCKENNL